MDNKRMTIDDLTPLYRTQSRILIGLKADYTQGAVKDGLVIEVDIKGKGIVNNPWSGQKKLKFSGYYQSIPDSEKNKVLLEIQEAFHETVIMEMVDLLRNPSSEAIKSLIWEPERLKGKTEVMKYNTLSQIQRGHFKDISGKDYKGKDHDGSFWTEKPFNDANYDGSPCKFSYIFDTTEGYFVCELISKFMGNQIFGWDDEGKELSGEIKTKYFESDGLGFRIV